MVVVSFVATFLTFEQFTPKLESPYKDD